MPEIDVLVVVAADEEIQFAVAIVIQPDGGVGIDPRGQSGLLGDAGEVLAAVVVIKLRLAPLVQEQVLVAVVVVVAPDRAHGDARAGQVDIGQAHLRGHIVEMSVVAGCGRARCRLPSPLLST